MFVTAQDFATPPYKLVNIDEDMEAEFLAHVEQTERDNLRKILGSSLYTAFVNGLNELPDEWVGGTQSYATDAEVSFGTNTWRSLQDDNIDHEPEEGAWWTVVEANNRWLRLKEGDTYTLERDGKHYTWYGMKKLIKPLQVSEWLKDTFDSHAGNGGVTMAKNENSERISPARRISLRWNEYSHLVGNKCELKDTLYGYLISENRVNGTFDDTFDETFTNFVDYLEFNFKGPGLKNAFNL